MPEEQVKDIQQSEPVVDIPTEGDPVDIELKEDSSPKDQGTEQTSSCRVQNFRDLMFQAGKKKESMEKNRHWRTP